MPPALLYYAIPGFLILLSLKHGFLIKNKSTYTKKMIPGAAWGLVLVT